MRSYEAWCVTCGCKRPVAGAWVVQLRNGRTGIRGNCAVCGQQLFIWGGRRLEQSVSALDKSPQL